MSGIARYSELHGPWDFLIRPGDFAQVVPEIRRWGGTGIIARIPNALVARRILKCGLPTIALGLSDEQLERGNPLSKLCNIGSNPAQVAQMAVDYFLNRCFSFFGYVGAPDRSWSSRREKEYNRILRKRGFVSHTYVRPRSPGVQQWEYEIVLMAEWIKRLPKPIGLFACDDSRGREVLEACMLGGVRVPEEVAVLGVDDDDVFCNLAQPPLSSITLNAEGAGYQAARLLEEMMQSGRTVKKHIEVQAVGVVSRRSTEIVAVGDPGLSKALRFIHDNRGVAITVADVIEHAGISRRGLEKRFREFLRRSILDELQNVRLDEAKRLLLDTSLSITYVALTAGFTNSAYFSQFFHQRVGMTPRQYRRVLAR